MPPTSTAIDPSLRIDTFPGVGLENTLCTIGTNERPLFFHLFFLLKDWTISRRCR
uniref:Cl1856_1 n=1 Tax=Arundo donax TaxID=35708 RepID=A0A0A9E2Y5_ARUDO